MKKNTQKLFVILTIVVILLIGLGIYLFTKKPNKIANNQIPSINVVTENKTAIKSTQKQSPDDETKSWKTYSNNQYNFEFKYPNNWTIDSSDYSLFKNGKFVITLNNPEIRQNTIISIQIISPGNDDLKKYAREEAGVGIPVSIESEENIITKNGIPALYTIINDTSYTDHEYVIGNNKLILWFNFREISRSFSPGGTEAISETKLTEYLPIYKNIINSVKFTK